MLAICFILYRMLSSAFLTMPHPMSLQDTMESKHAYMMHVFTSQRMARQEPAAL